MSETQAEVLTMIEAVAKGRGEPLNAFMDSEFGAYWSDRYYIAQPDASSQVEATQKQAPIQETSGFTLLQARAKELLAKNSTMTEAQAVVKACEMYPDLTTRHTDEIRKAIAKG